jgi:hypothetical protein
MRALALLLVWLDDPGNELSARQVLAKPWTPYHAALARGFPSGTTWVRLKVDPGAAVAMPGTGIADRRLMELTRLRGHLPVVAGGVHDGRHDGPVHAGVQAAEGGVGAHWAHTGLFVQGICPSAMTIGTWVKRAERDESKGDGGLTSAEREEMTRLRRENRKLREAREILSKAAAWFATESGPSKRSSGS